MPRSTPRAGPMRRRRITRMTMMTTAITVTRTIMITVMITTMRMAMCTDRAAATITDPLHTFRDHALTCAHRLAVQALCIRLDGLEGGFESGIRQCDRCAQQRCELAHRGCAEQAQHLGVGGDAAIEKGGGFFVHHP